MIKEISDAILANNADLANKVYHKNTILVILKR